MPDYWAKYEGKNVPLKDLLKWLSDEHDHVTDDEGEPLGRWNFPVVNSMALHQWAIAEASADEYEYAMEFERFGVKLLIMDREWGTLETAQERLKFYTEAWTLNGNHEYNKAKLVKRRKAGGMEDV